MDNKQDRTTDRVKLDQGPALTMHMGPKWKVGPRAVLEAFRHWGNPDGTNCHPSHALIAGTRGLSVRAVAEHVATLERSGVIIRTGWQVYGSQKRVPIYAIQPPALWPAEPAANAKSAFARKPGRPKKGAQNDPLEPSQMQNPGFRKCKNRNFGNAEFADNPSTEDPRTENNLFTTFTGRAVASDAPPTAVGQDDVKTSRKLTNTQHDAFGAFMRLWPRRCRRPAWVAARKAWAEALAAPDVNGDPDVLIEALTVQLSDLRASGSVTAKEWLEGQGWRDAGDASDEIPWEPQDATQAPTETPQQSKAADKGGPAPAPVDPAATAAAGTICKALGHYTFVTAIIAARLLRAIPEAALIAAYIDAAHVTDADRARLDDGDPEARLAVLAGIIDRGHAAVVSRIASPPPDPLEPAAAAIGNCLGRAFMFAGGRNRDLLRNLLAYRVDARCVVRALELSGRDLSTLPVSDIDGAIDAGWLTDAFSTWFDAEYEAA